MTEVANGNPNSVHFELTKLKGHNKATRACFVIDNLSSPNVLEGVELLVKAPKNVLLLQQSQNALVRWSGLGSRD